MNTPTTTIEQTMNGEDQFSILEILQDVLDIVDDQVDLFGFDDSNDPCVSSSRCWNESMLYPNGTMLPMNAGQLDCETAATTTTTTTTTTTDQQRPDANQQHSNTTLVEAIGAMISKNYYPTDNPLQCK